MQRLHLDDLTGFLLSQSDEWTLLSLQAIADPGRNITRFAALCQPDRVYGMDSYRKSPKIHHPLRPVVSEVHAQLSRSRGNDGRTRDFSGPYDDNALDPALCSGIRKVLEPLCMPSWRLLARRRYKDATSATPNFRSRISALTALSSRPISLFAAWICAMPRSTTQAKDTWAVFPLATRPRQGSGEWRRHIARTRAAPTA
jgi:hypothetical protein